MPDAKIVPREPTVEMLRVNVVNGAASDWPEHVIHCSGCLLGAVWSAMYDAAPAQAEARELATIVDRFLVWPLPKDFAPDCGISFDGRKDDEWNKNKSWPIGTNLFTADQARAMFQHALAASQHQPQAEARPAAQDGQPNNGRVDATQGSVEPETRTLRSAHPTAAPDGDLDALTYHLRLRSVPGAFKAEQYARWLDALAALRARAEQAGPRELPDDEPSVMGGAAIATFPAAHAAQDGRELDARRLKDLSRTELYRVLDEFKSERDAAKASAMRAFDERNIALAELAALRERAEQDGARLDALERLMLHKNAIADTYATMDGFVILTYATVRGDVDSITLGEGKTLRAAIDAAIDRAREQGGNDRG